MQQPAGQPRAVHGRKPPYRNFADGKNVMGKTSSRQIHRKRDASLKTSPRAATGKQRQVRRTGHGKATAKQKPCRSIGKDNARQRAFPDTAQAQTTVGRTSLRVLLAAASLALLLCVSPLRVMAEESALTPTGLPYGWQAERTADGLWLARSPAADAVVAACSGSLPEDTSEQALLQTFINYFSGSEAQQRADRGHQFHFQHDSTQHTALLYTDRQRYMLITVTDPANRYPESIEMLVQSLAQQLKDGPKAAGSNTRHD
ncbi:hypothetical protein [uncultured Desulfovibrio sp.]|uniref:hypothetical protein n=1 Tax=uncultured Desulfovibrio sp. TaxID=167968 RepID=UPI00261557B5|nr:hypothetical protein [uncultured Desulfovibrio sp.]